MIPFLKKYKAFLIGLIIVPIFYLLDAIGFIHIPKNRPVEFIAYTIFWGLVIALPIHNFMYLKRKKKTVIRVFCLIILFIMAFGIDSIMKVPDNPITFILLMGFWFGFAYVLLPHFIKKYWKLIALFYIPLFLYFIYLRLFSGDLEDYLKIKEEFPFIIFFLPIPILFFVWVFEQWKWLQNLKAEKAQAELAMLQAQINPHFFFNTLNNLYALTIKNSEKAPEVILKLSEMMRYTIYEGKKNRVPIKNEIDYLNNYIALHKIRYRNKVDIQFNHNIDSNIEIAPLLFIILLENAFKHGLEKNHDDGFIHMDLNANSKQIQFIIKNTFDPNQINKTNGIGLSNLKKRLSLTYLNNYKLDIYNEMNIHIVTLKIFLS
ncbi:hypothetical protein A9Q86_11760 [Flavobacteriales bacterium 33_180_T64]|nr:hypothetical protein A9Q86_11760 [Flavobacteriales bacterium 33_180_T64]